MSWNVLNWPLVLLIYTGLLAVYGRKVQDGVRRSTAWCI
jgi:hypothetical protein